MKNKFTFLILAILILSSFVIADLGPKPSVDIDVYYNSNKVSDASFSARMLDCVSKDEYYPKRNFIPQLNISEYDSEKDCNWMPSSLAWGGDCKKSKCHFSYRPPSKFKLAVYIPSLDKVFITNEISRTNFNSNYEVKLNNENVAIITETTSFLSTDKISLFINALMITLVLELLVALIYLSIKKLSKKILVSVFIANIISLPIVWFIFPSIGNIFLVILLSEIFAVVFEKYFIYYSNRNLISRKKSFVMSLIMNMVSLFVGGFFLLILSSLGF